MPAPPGFGADDYGQALVRLGPRGLIWRTDPASIYVETLRALAPTYERSTAAAAHVLLETSPATTLDLLPEWEASLGLPDECSPPDQTLQQRQAAVRAKWGGRGGLTADYFIEMAAALGFTITITEFTPYVADMPCDEPDLDASWAHAWEVTIVAPDVALYFSADISTAEEPLVTYVGVDELICRIQDNAPADTVVIFVIS